MYGPLANGSTTVLFDTHPLFPDPGRYWEMSARVGVTQAHGLNLIIEVLQQNYNFHSRQGISVTFVLMVIGNTPYVVVALSMFCLSYLIMTKKSRII